MNKRLIIGVLLLVVCVIGITVGISEFLSYKKVSVVFKQPDLTVVIYSADKNKVTTISDSAVIKLKTGQYYYVSSNEKYTQENIYFTVVNNESVEINPSYSYTYLLSLLKEQKTAIHTVLSAQYPTLNTNYIISDERLAHHGEWYSAKLIERVSGGNEPDVYRVILENKNNSWSIAVKPRLVISSAEFPSIPKYIITQVNGPLSNEAYALLYPE